MVKIIQKQQLQQKLNVRQIIEASLFQLNSFSLEQRIYQELEKNPLLEPESKKEKKNLYNSKLYLNSKENNSKSKYIENTLEQKKNLRDHINEQINIDLNNNSEEKLIAQKFLEQIDNNGYIKDDDANKIYKKLQVQHYNVTLFLVESTLKKIQEFDPPGVFARNLSECIEIQLKSKKLFNSKYHFLVRNLELLAKNDIGMLSKKTRIKKNELIRMIKNIKSLNPKPASIFDHQPNISVIPDIILKQSKDSFKLEINKSQIPKFNFNKELYQIIKKKKIT